AYSYIHLPGPVARKDGGVSEGNQAGNLQHMAVRHPHDHTRDHSKHEQGLAEALHDTDTCEFKISTTVEVVTPMSTSRLTTNPLILSSIGAGLARTTSTGASGGS